MKKIKVVHDFMTNISWVVHLVMPGERYGVKNSVVNSSPEPLVEFYDSRYNLTDLGQMVSRYRMSTLLNRPEEGLNLDSATSQWTLSKVAMLEVTKWLRARQEEMTHASA